MKRASHSITIGWLACVLILFGAAPDARAEGSPYRAQLNETSLRGALSGRTVQILEAVSPEGGRESQASRLISLLARGPDRRIHVSNPGRPRLSRRSMILFAADESWYLEVIGDGSRFRYRGNIDDPAEIEKARTLPPLDMQTLERLGRDYVTQRLAPLLPLGTNETIVFLGTRYLREGSASELDQKFTSEVVANIAVFAREVMGTFVAGPGSKIAVWFSNSGEAVGFDIDWPEYRVTTAVQSTLPIDGVWNRFSGYADAPRQRIQSNVRRFECGYIDLGVFKRQGSPIQAGCYALHTGPMESDEVYASSEVIPIGDPVISDPRWPLTEFVAAGKPWDICRALPQSCIEPLTMVTIDIKPGSVPNSINPRSRGVIPVAILTTEVFDATTVDPQTVRFGPKGSEASPVHAAVKDVDGDGRADLILHFRTRDAGISCGATSAALTGETAGGQAIQGSDSVSTVGCR